MKRLIAIFFLCVFLFNFFGYRILIHYLKYREEGKLELRAQTVTNSDLVSIKVAAVLPPYTYSSDNYEAVNGEVDIDGMTYKYIKRKIFKDSIEFLCLPHIEKKRLENAREEFFKLSNDLQNSADQKKSSNSLQIKPLVFEYCSLTESYDFLPLNDNLINFYAIFTEMKHYQFKGSVDHPPEKALLS